MGKLELLRLGNEGRIDCGKRIIIQRRAQGMNSNKGLGNKEMISDCKVDGPLIGTS